MVSILHEDDDTDVSTAKDSSSRPGEASSRPGEASSRPGEASSRPVDPATKHHKNNHDNHGGDHNIGGKMGGKDPVIGTAWKRSWWVDGSKIWLVRFAEIFVFCANFIIDIRRLKYFPNICVIHTWDASSMCVIHTCETPSTCMIHTCEAASMCMIHTCEAPSICMIHTWDSLSICMIQTCEAPSTCMIHTRSAWFLWIFKSLLMMPWNVCPLLCRPV